MAIQKSHIEDKSIRPDKSDTQSREDNLKEIEFNYPGQVTIKAKSKKEADKKFNKFKKDNTDKD